MTKTFDHSYPHPQQLSDPFRDWQNQDLSLITKKATRDLRLKDYNVIFFKCLPAASYEEGAFYLDACFDFMLRKQSPFGVEICEGIFYFIDMHKRKLQADDLLDSCLAATVSLLRTYTSEFVLTRLSDSQLEQAGSKLRSRERAQYSRSLRLLFLELCEYSLYETTVLKFLDSLDVVSVEGSGWWIELANVSFNWFQWYKENTGKGEVRRKQRIFNRMFRLDRSAAHLKFRDEYAKGLGFQQYIRDVTIVPY